MNYIFFGMITAAYLVGILKGSVDKLQTAILTEGAEAIALIIKLAGGLCFWGGIMKIAEKSGISRWVSRLLKPLCKRLFKGVNPNSQAAEAISLNISANILGLGNAATPFGLQAMKFMQKDNPNKAVATTDMIVFTVINSSSIQLIPTTLALMRQNHNSKAPLEILLPVIITSIISVIVGVGAAKLFARRRR